MGAPVLRVENKAQFTSTETLDLVFLPFLDSSLDYIVTGLDTITITLKAPNNTTFNPAAVWDSDAKMWISSLAVVSFQAGEWLVYAVSDEVGSLPQFSVLYWGDYVDDIQETRQAAVGRWKITGTTLELFEDDGVTVFKSFALKDSLGNPSSVNIFDKDPI